MSRWVASASSSSTTCSRSTSTCPPTRRACSRSPTASRGNGAAPDPDRGKPRAPVQPCVTVAERSYASTISRGRSPSQGWGYARGSTLRSTRRLYQLERLDGPRTHAPPMQARVLLEAEIRELIGPRPRMPRCVTPSSPSPAGRRRSGRHRLRRAAHQGEVTSRRYLHGRPSTRSRRRPLLWQRGEGTAGRQRPRAGLRCDDRLPRRRPLRQRLPDRAAHGRAGPSPPTFSRGAGRKGRGHRRRRQARFQIEALALVRRPESIAVFSRTPRDPPPARARWSGALASDPCGYRCAGRRRGSGRRDHGDAVARTDRTRGVARLGYPRHRGRRRRSREAELEPAVLARAGKVVVDRSISACVS